MCHVKFKTGKGEKKDITHAEKKSNLKNLLLENIHYIYIFLLVRAILTDKFEERHLMIKRVLTLPTFTCTLASCGKIKRFSDSQLSKMIIGLANISWCSLYKKLIESTAIICHLTTLLKKYAQRSLLIIRSYIIVGFWYCYNVPVPFAIWHNKCHSNIVRTIGMVDNMRERKEK